MAMPEPMVPAPMTAMRCTARGTAPSSDGCLALSRSAKNWWRSAKASRETRRRWNSARSSARPSSMLTRAAAVMASIAACTAGRCLPAFSAAAAAAATAAASAAGTARSRRRCLRPPSWRACATAAARRSPAASSSISPAASAAALDTRSPLQIMPMARGMPTMRGSRCVPPAPGMMPSVTSGRPTTVPGAATRASQPSASSKPPPSAAPCSAATTGLPQSSMARITAGSGRLGQRLAELAQVGAGDEGVAGADQHRAAQARVDCAPYRWPPSGLRALRPNRR